MKRQAETAFIEKLSDLLKLKFPEYFLEDTEEDIKSKISHLVDEAHSADLQKEQDVGCYVQLRLEFGEKAKFFLSKPSSIKGKSDNIYTIRRNISLELSNQP